MKILVTGANGYLGQGIIKALLDYGCDICAADISNDGIDVRAHFFQADIFGIDKPYEFFEAPDTVLHLAWKNGFRHNALSHITELPKHYEFLSKLLHVQGIKKVCVMGSVHEIGFYEGSVDESTPTNPQCLYGISKNALRQAIEIEAKENNKMLQWIRGFYIVSNMPRGSSVFSKIVEAEHKGQTKFPFTKGQNQFDFIAYEKFCQQVALTVMQNEVLGIINCCTGQPQRLGERVEKFIKDNHFNIKLEYGVFPERTYDSKAIWGNSDKIEKICEAYRAEKV